MLLVLRKPIQNMRESLFPPLKLPTREKARQSVVVEHQLFVLWLDDHHTHWQRGQHVLRLARLDFPLLGVAEELHVETSEEVADQLKDRDHKHLVQSYTCLSDVLNVNRFVGRVYRRHFLLVDLQDG